MIIGLYDEEMMFTNDIFYDFTHTQLIETPQTPKLLIVKYEERNIS